jgi:hypothetical protein
MRTIVALMSLLSSIRVASADSEADRDVARLNALIREHPVYAQASPTVLQRRGHRRKVAGAVLLSIGVPALAAGGATMLAGAAAEGLSTLGCDPGTCRTSGPDRTLLGVGGGVAALGLAATIAGGTLRSMGRDDLEEARRLQVSLAPLDGGGKLVIAGRF